MATLTSVGLDLDFISDASLRKTVIDTIEYMVALLATTEQDWASERYVDETHRIVVLYVASAMEAIFLYCFKIKGYEIPYFDYKYVQNLPPEYIYANQQGIVVVALQKKLSKSDHQLGLHTLVNFYKDKKSIKAETAEQILEINTIRNTVHLTKPRTHACDITHVEAAFDTLVHVIRNSPKLLK